MSQIQGNTLRCPGCGASLMPSQGEKITCPYCDTVFLQPTPPPPPPQPNPRVQRMEARARIEEKKLEYRRAALDAKTKLREQREADRRKS